MTTKQKQSPLEGECAHESIKRDPPKDEHPINQEARKQAKKRALERRESALDRLIEAAATAEGTGCWRRRNPAGIW